MGLRKIIDRMKPAFSKGGRWERFASTFEAFETFAYTPNRVTGGKPGAGYRGCQLRDAVDMKRTIITVVAALMPALLFGMWNTGHQTSLYYGLDWNWWREWVFGLGRTVPVLAVTYGVGLFLEFLFAEIRHEEVTEGYICTGLLIALIVPATVPLWQLALAVAFAVVIGKEVFGGSGYNFMNPALLARAFLFFAYPSRMSGDRVWVAAPTDWAADAVSGATPLGELAAGVMPHSSVWELFVGTVPGCIGETSVVAILIGAAVLLLTGVASWRIMLGVVLGGGLTGLLFNLIAMANPQFSILNSQFTVPFYYHWLMGGFAFGAVFMATDPVTAAQTQAGKWIYGVLTGVLAVSLRVANPAYPEGMMLAILLMNCLAPLIDHCVVALHVRRRLRRWAEAERRAR